MRRFAALVRAEVLIEAAAMCEMPSNEELNATTHSELDSLACADALRARVVAPAGQPRPALPAKFMEFGLALAKGALIFGRPLESLSREELLAVAARGWTEERKASEEAYESRRREFSGHAGRLKG